MLIHPTSPTAWTSSHTFYFVFIVWKQQQTNTATTRLRGLKWTQHYSDLICNPRKGWVSQGHETSREISTRSKRASWFSPSTNLFPLPDLSRFCRRGEVPRPAEPLTRGHSLCPDTSSPLPSSPHTLPLPSEAVTNNTQSNIMAHNIDYIKEQCIFLKWVKEKCMISRQAAQSDRYTQHKAYCERLFTEVVTHIHTHAHKCHTSNSPVPPSWRLKLIWGRLFRFWLIADYPLMTLINGVHSPTPG